MSGFTAVDNERSAMAESLISNIISDDLDSLALILSTTGDRDSWHAVIRYELDILQLADVGRVLQYDIVAPKLTLWGTKTISAYHLAAMRGADEILSRFVNEFGVVIDCRLHSGATALHLACFAGQLDTVRSLVDHHRAEVNRKDQYGWTALHYASVEGQFDVVQLLLDRRADVNARDKDGATAAFRARASGHHDVVCLMESVGSEDLLLIAEDDYDSTNCTRTSAGRPPEPTYSTVRKVASPNGQAIDWLKSNDYETPDVEYLQKCRSGGTAQQQRQTDSTTSGSSKATRVASTAMVRRLISEQLKEVFDENENPYMEPVRESEPAEQGSASDAAAGIGYNTLSRVVREELQRFRSVSMKTNQATTTTNAQCATGSEGIYEEIGKGAKPKPVVTDSRPKPNEDADIYVPEPSYPPPLPPMRQSTISPLNKLTEVSPAAVKILRRIEHTNAVMDMCFETIVGLGFPAAGDWKRLARALPMCNGKPEKVEKRIRAIETRYANDEKKQANAALNEWRQCRGEKANVQTLVDALRKCRLTEAASLLKKSTEESTV